MKNNPLGIFSSIFGGGDDVTQTTDIEIINENTFNPNVIVDVAIGGLEALGGALREGFNTIAGQGSAQTASLDQGALNVASAINGAGVNISSGLLGASENIEESVVSLGVNIGFAVVAGATVLAVSGALRRG